MNFIDSLLNHMSSTFNQESVLPRQAEISMDETFKWRALKNNQFASRSKNRRLSKHKSNSACNISNNIKVVESYTSTSVILEDNVIEIQIANDISNVEIQEALAISIASPDKPENITGMNQENKTSSNENENTTLYANEEKSLESYEENETVSAKQFDKDLPDTNSSPTVFVCTSLKSSQENLDCSENIQQHQISQYEKQVDQLVNNHENQVDTLNISKKHLPIRRSKRLNNQSDRELEQKIVEQTQQPETKNLEKSLTPVKSLQLLSSEGVDDCGFNNPFDSDIKMKNSSVNTPKSQHCDTRKDKPVNKSMKMTRSRYAQNTRARTRNKPKAIIDNNSQHISVRNGKNRNLHTSIVKSVSINTNWKTTRQCNRTAKHYRKSQERARKIKSLKKYYARSSQRVSKDGSDGILASAIARREKNDAVGFQGRLSRPIKLSAKILANEDLKNEFELRKIARSNTFSDIKENAMPAEANSSDNLEKSKHLHQHRLPLEPPDDCSNKNSKKYQSAQDCLGGGGESDQTSGKNKLSEDESSFCQTQKMLDLKEKHFLMLGLRRRDSRDVALEVSQEHESKATESCHKTNSKSTFAQDSVILDKTEHAETASSAKIISKQDELTMLPVVRHQKKYVCHCQQRSKFFIAKTQSNGLCTAIDDIDGYYVGCRKKLHGDLQNLLRPGCKVSYQLLCHMHRRRLRCHDCCPACGIFCTQGDFVICSRRHLFHRSCSNRYTTIENKNSNIMHLKCPHCGIQNPDNCSNVQLRCYIAPSLFRVEDNAKVN
ncbi:uncharacterized protein LOC129777169 [Toxorhynchites rutilus septentrionalis]|uniref:uncharacterized protein LOC129777169 n=1 Tax=Toxorhynchites rutilus septentrionalis TaxID=329112 RepID=UPI0024796F84|nr:uncharacterized protein LOC129777169 [Toxorhynchites rutilus septentrionalis]XP_055639239.1 uncharacterized protein LOC129777169 [Toxorhynchites rutilus septentrionalis]